MRDGVGTTFVAVDEQRVARGENAGYGVQVYGDGNGNGRVDAGDARRPFASGLTAEHVLGAAASRLLVESESPKAYLHADHLGSIIATTDGDGTVRGQQAFRLHGARRAAHGFVGAYGFTGQQTDETTGLVHMQFRELDPVTGRWDRFDPLFVAPTSDAMNATGESSTGYAYVANQTGSHRDPTGLLISNLRKLYKIAKKKIAQQKKIEARRRLAEQKTADEGSSGGGGRARSVAVVSFGRSRSEAIVDGPRRSRSDAVVSGQRT